MKKLTCSIGDKFGDWIVIGNTFPKNGHTYVTVICKCGKVSDLCLSDLVHGRVHSCKNCSARRRGHMHKLHIGDKIKKWTIIEGPRVYNNTVQFKVQCECGFTRWIQPNELLNPNKCFSCKKCSHKPSKHLMLSQFNKIKKSAEVRGLEFNVSIEYLWDLFLKQNKRCSITGDLFSNIREASLDRIDSNIGYVEGNVQWVTYRANVSKHTMTMSELYNFCLKVLNYANQQPSQPLTKLEGSETNT